jgi:hypothetical protein
MNRLWLILTAGTFLFLYHPACAQNPTSATAFLENGPVSYFENNCARCHGSLGSSYGAGFGKKLSTAALRKTISDMARGPGQAPISGLDLDAQLAFHQALIAHSPYIAVTSIDDAMIKGETIPGSTITATGSAQKLAVKTEEYNWQVSLVPGVKPQQVTISASLNNQQTSMTVGTRPFTVPNTGSAGKSNPVK